MVITKIAAIKGNDCGVWIDGHQRLTVAAEVVYEEGLQPGMEIDDAYLTALAHKADLAAAKSKAMDLLGVRDYCFAELVERLRRRFDEPTAAAAASRMEELGLVSDAGYAEKYARELMRRGCSLRRAAYDMRGRGLSAEVVDEALAPYADSEQDRIEAVVRKKYGRKLSGSAGQRGVQAALARQGFAYEDIRAVLLRLSDTPDWEE